MSDYKVPQNVEAEDKLLGPFSFKQFIFLGIAAAFAAMAYGLSRIALPLAVIPAPIALFFLILALPLRKEQPMEVYLAAVISFLLKPRLRMWNPDGVESIITVTAPPSDDRFYGKGYSQEEVQQRLSYLANLVDSRGWSARGVTDPDSPLQTDLYNEAQATDDLLDDSGERAQHIESLLAQNDAARRQQLIAQMQQQSQAAQQLPPQPQPQAVPQPQPTPAPQPAPQIMSSPYTPLAITHTSDGEVKLAINPYPLMSQSVISPLSSPQAAQPQTPPAAPEATSTPAPQPAAAPPVQPQTGISPVSPAIIDLAHNHKGLSVQTLQREAERIKEKQAKESEEVVISLR